MQDVLFVQFFSRSRNGYYDLANGFSDAHDLCKSKGDFCWICHESDSSLWYQESTYTGRPLPIEKGTVYVSASYINHLYQTVVWARQYPEIHFIAGGPVASARRCAGNNWEPLYFSLRDKAELPPNLTITGESVEDFFGAANFSGRWRLTVPGDKVPAHAPIYFSYTLDNGCYWGRCIYCNIKEAPPELFRRRRDMDFEFAELNHPGSKIVRLNTGSITPRYIREVLPNLPNPGGMQYRTFMRCARAENQALRKVFKQGGAALPPLTMGIGVEFPSNRMLAYMDKGISKEDILETLNICARHEVAVNGNIILGWGNLVEKDLRELADFLDRMPPGSMSSVQLRWLYAHPRTPIHEQYQGEAINLGPFYLGYKVDIPQEQQALNQEAVRLIEACSPAKGIRIEGLGNVSRNPGDGGHATD